MANQYPVALEGKAAFGGFYSGDSTEYEATVRVRPRAGVAVQLEAQRNTVDLVEGRFQTNLFRLETNTQFSPWISLRNNIQYDDVSRLLGWQLRFRWIQRPGNDLFLVYSHNWQEMTTAAGRSLQTLDSRLATKIVYTLRF